MRRGLLIASGVCLVLSGCTEIFLIGYGMTALVFLFLACCFAFFGLLYHRDGLAARTARRVVIVVLVIGAILFLAAEIPILQDSRSDADTDADYLIVMGAGVNGSVPSQSLEDRLEAALLWLQDHPDAKAVLSGGQGSKEDDTEAQVMYIWLTEQGIDPDRLLLEDQASNTYENLEYSLEIIAEDGGDASGTVAMLSSEYHIHRVRYIAQSLGCDPVCVAAPTSIVALRINYTIREAFAMWKLYWF